MLVMETILEATEDVAVTQTKDPIVDLLVIETTLMAEAIITVAVGVTQTKDSIVEMLVMETTLETAKMEVVEAPIVAQEG